MVDDDDDVVENAWTTNVLLLCRPLFQRSAEAATSSDVNHGKLFVIMVVFVLWSRVSSCRPFFSFVRPVLMRHDVISPQLDSGLWTEVDELRWPLACARGPVSVPYVAPHV